jgi:hypothetical protein
MKSCNGGHLNIAACARTTERNLASTSPPTCGYIERLLINFPMHDIVLVTKC